MCVANFQKFKPFLFERKKEHFSIFFGLIENFLGFLNTKSESTTAEKVSGLLLRHIKSKAEEFQGKKLSEAVITIPAGFTVEQQSATRGAALFAGWRKIHLLPEPIAASFAYFVDRPLFINETVLLFDLGGGTLDVCILEIQNDKIQIISRSGDLNLGGRDFDNVLVSYFSAIMVIDYQIPEKDINKFKLMSECQKIKEDLSTNVDACLCVDNYDLTNTGFISIRRCEYEKLCKSLLSKVVEAIALTFSNIQYEFGKIDKTLLVGGGSRMPVIKNLIYGTFLEAEHCFFQHPEEIVAIGAAYHAYNVYGSSVEYLLNDALYKMVVFDENGEPDKPTEFISSILP